MTKIKVRTGHSDWSNIDYSRNFEIVDESPRVGGTLYGKTVDSVYEVTPDCEQGNPAVWSYDYFDVDTVDADGEEWEYNVAVAKASDPEDDPDEIEEGMTYSDPDGEWEVVTVDSDRITVKNVQSGNLNRGQTAEVRPEGK